MIKTTCFGHWFFIRKKCVLRALHKHSYNMKIFRIKNLMMANVGRNM